LLLGLGICRLELDQWTAAESAFQQLLQLNDPFFNDHAHWYLALTYLEQNQLEACRKSLQKLAAQSTADHHQQAVDLLQQLR
ncbi:MAG: tetratricopeptide repeat protein, partial [Bacteroidota bacterium]